MNIKVKEVRFNILNMRTRMPFRYGIAIMTDMPHLFLQVLCEIDGKLSMGIASEGLLPKWFTKNPDTSHEQEVEDMLTVIKKASESAKSLEYQSTVFNWWMGVYEIQQKWGKENNIPGLLWGFGVSMIERAVIDSFCKAKGVNFNQALKENLLGIELGQVFKELQNLNPIDLLKNHYPDQMFIRHTVGLVDALRQKDIEKKEQVNDGLPQSFEECLKVYGLQKFKFKVSGELDKDIARLIQIAKIIEESGLTNFAFTLDGNEQFNNAREFKVFWQTIENEPQLKEFFRHLIFVEQPIKRNNAITEETEEVFKQWDNKPLMIIDESDAELFSLYNALKCGYDGTSHKNCKGVFRGVINACLLEYYRRANPTKEYILSGEDLTTIGPVSLLQDLTVANALGISHIERNGHHYFRGLSMYSKEVQEKVLDHHKDLYEKHPAGFATLKIRDGKINIKTVKEAPFGLGIDFDPSIYTPQEFWEYKSLYEKL